MAVRPRSNPPWQLGTFSAKIKFLDPDGFVVATDSAYGLQAAGGSERTFNGDDMVAADVAGSVATAMRRVYP